ncbi:MULTISPECIES: phosphotransferase family protein [unclassified Exiguobacterium]|uniref:phosphotransferase family protein n=1 Tax=unclassified Exiguobacterium TaxID=2644629 RepID=UPI001BE819FC|nr:MULTISPECIES: aminoglycoside phosphotransferase family protein [unclassified Exiguobacterium]
MTRDEWIEHFQLDVVACATVDESYSSEVDRLILTDGQVVFLKRPYTAEKWYRERGWIHALEEFVPVPHILAEAAPGQTTGAFVLAALPGQAPVTMTKKLAYEIGRTLAMLHTCTGEAYGEYTEDGFYAYPVQDWRRFRNEKLDGFMPFITSELDPVFLENIQTELVRREQSLPEPSRPVATHCDFRLANLLTVGDQVTGVIDFETTRYGAVEMDFTKIVRNLNTFGSIYVTAFQEGYATLHPDVPIETYLAYYRLWEVLTAVGWCIKRGREEHQAFFEENIALIEQELQTTSISDGY